MHKARFGSDNFGQMRQEGDDVMLHFALDFIDALDIEDSVLALLPDLGGCFFRHHAQFGETIGGVFIRSSSLVARTLEPSRMLTLGRRQTYRSWTDQREVP